MASNKDWFETVAEAHAAPSGACRARSTALLAGSEGGVTVNDNTAAFGELGFIPRIATGLSGRP